MNPDDLKIWTKFACAALAGAVACPAEDDDFVQTVEGCSEFAALCADDMMEEFIKRREAV